MSKKFPDPPVGHALTPPATLDNMRHLLDMYQVQIRYNQTKKRLEATFPDTELSRFNHAAQVRAKIVSLCAKHGLPTSCVDEYLSTIAMENEFNPVGEWIKSKDWDQKDRFEEFFATLTIADGFDTDFAMLLLRKWLLSIVAAACVPGFRSRGILTLCGPQSIGKTSWFAGLIPGELGKDTIKTDHDWSGGSKDARITACSHQVVEWGELESSLKRGTGKFKAFITAEIDKIRRPYGREDIEYRRTTVFGASVNDAQFLADGTGNSRFWVLPITKINLNHGLDMQQLFAQLYTDIENNAQWWLNSEEEAQLTANNMKFTPANPIAERIMEEIDLTRIGDGSAQRFSASALLRECGINNPSTVQARECGRVLREHLGEPTFSHSIAYWKVPLRSDKSSYGRHGMVPPSAQQPALLPGEVMVDGDIY